MCVCVRVLVLYIHAEKRKTSRCVYVILLPIIAEKEPVSMCVLMLHVIAEKKEPVSVVCVCVCVTIMWLMRSHMEKKAWHCVCVVVCECVRMHAYRELYILDIEKGYVSRNRQEPVTQFTTRTHKSLAFCPEEKGCNKKNESC